MKLPANNQLLRVVDNVPATYYGKVPRDKFIKVHPRIGSVGIKGIGHYQQDVSHRASTFLRSEMLGSGKSGVRNYNTIFINKKFGEEPFWIGINPWKRTICQEGSSVMKN